MAFYRNSYVPAFTSNDTYGNFYDASKVSLITVPERLKNYDLDVRKAGTPTTAAEYGDFMRRDGQYRPPAGFSRLREQSSELQQARYPTQPQQEPPYQGGAGSYDYGSQQPAAPPQPLPRYLPPLATATASQQMAGPAVPTESPSPASPETSPRESVRGPPPPATLERYGRVGVGNKNADPLPVQRTQPPPPSEAPPARPEEPYQYRISRSRSPPPPPDMGAYRSNPDVYTGRGRGVAFADATQQPQQPQQHQQQLLSSQQPPLRLEPQLPPVRLGNREVYLPGIEAVEVRMRDNSRVLLDVQDFYRRYLRD